MRIAAALTLALAVAACTSEEAPELSSIADQALTGTVAGQAWTLVDGDVAPFLASNTEYVASLFDVARGGCDAAWPEAGGVLQVEFPREVGAYELSALRSVSMAPIGNFSAGVAAASGLLVISEITADRVRGGLRAEADDNNHVEGRFDVQICE